MYSAAGKSRAAPAEYPPFNAKKANIQVFQLGNCMEKYERSGGVVKQWS